MADDIVIPIVGTDQVRARQKAGAKAQVVVIDAGGAGAEALLALGQALAAGSLPVVIASDQGPIAIGAIPAGSANIGNVGVVTVPADPFGVNADAAVAAGAAGSQSAKLRRISQGLEDLKTSIVLAAGAAAIGKLAANAGVNIGTVDVASQPKSATATLSNVASATSNATLLAANAARLGASIFNDSSAILYVKFGATASPTSHVLQVAAGGYYELPGSPIYTGRIDGIWASANGSARVTELT